MTDFFDNRTTYFSTQADLAVQKTSRLSFDLGGDGFFVRRRSKALAGVTGGAARGDVEYRVSRNSTIGAQYSYNHFDFSRTFGGTDIHGASLAYAVQLTRFLEFSGYGGIMRVESKYIRAVPLDPVIAAILGISQGTEVAHRIDYVPNWSARLSRTFSNGVAYIGGGQTVTPGNGLFLTSYAATMLGGYTYTGLRRWSFSMQAGFIRSKSVTNVTGAYTNSDATISASRQIFPSVHFVASYSARQYSSPDFSKYNRFVQTATIGLGFAPGDVPLRVR